MEFSVFTGAAVLFFTEPGWCRHDYVTVAPLVSSLFFSPDSIFQGHVHSEE
jgi:hypothetical protein